MRFEQDQAEPQLTDRVNSQHKKYGNLVKRKKLRRASSTDFIKHLSEFEKFLNKKRRFSSDQKKYKKKLREISHVEDLPFQSQPLHEFQIKEAKTARNRSKEVDFSTIQPMHIQSKSLISEDMPSKDMAFMIQKLQNSEERCQILENEIARLRNENLDIRQDFQELKR